MAFIKPAPIACSLSAMEFKDRAASIAQLTATSLLSHRIDGCTAHLLYRQDAKQAVEQLVQQEQSCCGFLSFEIGQSSDVITLTITAPQEAQSDAEALFAHLLPSQETHVDAAVANGARSCGCVSPC
ncbi:hypothetical protein H8L32_06250 [Undibacterium sp. CY18W]|uniref:Uncharacterized protein n=1 Tax=Undibacterium hunanense TaxID=2762292 RepID=A0ABR6ZNP3_9BURK|nr:hypothetical protein [Undibacterium hunanense]MBC3917070.1 hypothetical protein [Undibacterium hunanense]